MSTNTEVVVNFRYVPLILSILLVASSSHTLAQSWESIGPDSNGWTNVARVAGRTTPGGTLDIAAITYSGIPTKSGSGPWDYTLRNIPNSVFIQGVDYVDLEFSPWELDSIFVGFGYYDTEWIPVYLESRWPLGWMPGPSAPGLIGGNCWFPPFSVVFPRTSDSTVYLTICGLRKSTDRGATWIIMDSTLADGRMFVGADYYNAAVVYKTAPTAGGNTLHRSTDGGATWDSLLTSLPSLWYFDRAVSVVAFGDTIITGLRTGWTDTTSIVGIVRTTDGGLTWQHLYSGGRIAGLQAAVTGYPFVYAAGEEGVFRSTDYGETWQVFNNVLPTNRITSLLLTPSQDTVLVSTATHGILKVWHYTVGVTGELRPQRFALHPNYPNPFNPSTTFTFDIQHSTFVTLKVYDLLGREVARIVEEPLSSGTYQRVFDAHPLAGGIYIARLQAGGFSQSRKVILVR